MGGVWTIEAHCSLFDRFLPGIHIEKQLRWAHKLGGAEPQGICRAGQTVLARVMEFQVWYPPAGSVALWGKGFRKETVASAHLSVWEKAVPQLSP